MQTLKNICYFEKEYSSGLHNHGFMTNIPTPLMRLNRGEKMTQKKYVPVPALIKYLVIAITFLLANMIPLSLSEIKTNEEFVQDLNEAKKPSKRIYHTMIDHTKTDLLLLFGGHSEHGWVADLRDIWAVVLKQKVSTALCTMRHGRMTITRTRGP